MTQVLFVANWDWVLAHFRLPLARRLRDEGYEVVLCCPPGEHAAELTAAGFAWHPWKMERRSMGAVRELRSLVELARIVDAQPPDVAHAFTIKPVVYLGLVVAWRALRRRSRPRLLIANLTGLGYLFSGAWRARVARFFLWPMLAAALRQSRARTVLMNEGDRQRLARLWVLSEKRTHLVRGTGVDTERFSPAEADGAGAERGVRPPRALFAARLLASKGVGEFFEAAQEVGARHADVEFLVAGEPDEGNPDAIPEDTVIGWHEAGVVRWLGHVSDLAGLLAEVDVLAVPTAYPEGIPRILLEGAAVGCAVVTSDTEGCREVIEHRRNGLLVPPRDPAALAEAIEALLNDPVKRAVLAAEARRDAVERFDLETINTQWVELYRQWLEGEDA